jgi:hypothetical protein
MTKGIKHPSPFKIKMGFDEALGRFIQTKPREVEVNIKKSKRKKPKQKKPKQKKPPGRIKPRRQLRKKRR